LIRNGLGIAVVRAAGKDGHRVMGQDRSRTRSEKALGLHLDESVVMHDKHPTVLAVLAHFAVDRGEQKR